MDFAISAIYKGKKRSMDGGIDFQRYVINGAINFIYLFIYFGSMVDVA